MAITITVIKGDGIGPGIVESAIQILDKVNCKHLLSRLS